MIEKYGPMEFIGDREFVWRRIYNCPYYYYREEIGHPSWNGFYLKLYGMCPVASKAFIPGARPGGAYGCGHSLVVLFPGDFREYYLVAELSDGGIILVDFNLGYYIVRPDLTREYLFTATSYAGSRNELQEWMAKIKKKRLTIPKGGYIER